MPIIQGLRSYVGIFQVCTALFNDWPYPFGLSNLLKSFSNLFLFSGEKGTLEMVDPCLNYSYSFLTVFIPTIGCLDWMEPLFFVENPYELRDPGWSLIGTLDFLRASRSIWLSIPLPPWVPICLVSEFYSYLSC